MGSSQSIPSTSEITDAPVYVSNVKEYTASTKNGPKTKLMDQTNPISVTLDEEESIADSDASIVSAESDDDDYSSDEEEADGKQKEQFPSMSMVVIRSFVHN